MVSASSALVLALFLVVSLVAVTIVGFGAFLLLSASVLSFVDANGHSDVFVQRIGLILLVQLVFDVFLQTVVEHLLKSFLVDFRSHRVLPE